MSSSMSSMGDIVGAAIAIGTGDIARCNADANQNQVQMQNLSLQKAATAMGVDPSSLNLGGDDSTDDDSDDGSIDNSNNVSSNDPYNSSYGTVNGPSMSYNA